MMVLEGGPISRMVTLSALVTIAVLSTLMREVGSEILYAETATVTFEAWAADLKPGFMLQHKAIGDRQCVCKKPGMLPSYSYSSFVFPTPGPLTSSGPPDSSFDYIFITTTTGAGNGGNSTVANNITRTSGACGQCNMDILIDDSFSGQSYDWTSPGWTQGKNYPDGCRCVLTVRYRATQFGVLVWTFASGSSIKALNNCAFDRMDVVLNGVADRWCDTTLSTKSGSDVIMGTNADYIFTFISDAADGNLTDKGFKLTIEASLFR